MDGVKGKEEKDDGKLNARNALLVAVASAVVGGTGGPFLLVKFGGPTLLRPDPYTGTEGKILEQRIKRLEAHVTNHPDAIGQFDRRITILETQNEIIIDNQARILDRLDRK